MMNKIDMNDLYPAIDAFTIIGLKLSIQLLIDDIQHFVNMENPSEYQRSDAEENSVSLGALIKALEFYSEPDNPEVEEYRKKSNILHSLLVSEYF